MISRSVRGLGLAALLFVAACGAEAREAEPFAGVWESDGWGTYLLIDGGDVEIFEHTAVHCLSVAAGSARGVSDVLSLEGERLVMRDSDREVRFDRTEFLPALCADSGASSDPAYAMAVAAATVDEQFIGSLDPTWEPRRSDLLRRAAGVDDTTLSALLQELLAPLGGAVRFATGEGEVWPTPPEFVPPVGTVTGGLEGFATGALSDGIGYLGLARVGPFDPVTMDSEQITSRTLDEALDNQAFVLDLRRADGGVLGHALLIATRFVSSETVVGRLEARDGAGTVDAGDLTVFPTPRGPYPGEVAVLIGPDTRGVAELLAFVLGELPGVTVIGSATAGSPGPPLVRFLPNGWSLAVPNLTLFGPTGERVGSVEPDVASDDPLIDAVSLLTGD